MCKLALIYTWAGRLRAALYGDPEFSDLKHLGKRLKYKILVDGVVAYE